MHAPFALGAAELLVDASVGVSLFPADAETAETLRKHADAAMYEAKAAGGGVHVYGLGTADPFERLELAARLRRGIERGELELHHQPILRLADAAVMGVESLVRWRDPTRGLVPPGEFIGVAERTGVIDPLGRLGAARRLPPGARVERPRPDARTSASTSRRASCAAPTSRPASPRSCSAHGIEPSRFVLELTESAWSLEASRLLPVLGELRAAGFALAIDDFGAGYSSLWRLRELPVQIIKVDRAFLRGVPADAQGRSVYSAILQLADAVRLRRRRRGRRAGRAGRVPDRERLPHRPGLPLQPPGARSRDDRAAPGVDRVRAPSLAQHRFATLLRRPWPFRSRSNRTPARHSAARSTRSPLRR